MEGAATAGPLHLLPKLSEEGRAAFVAQLPETGVVENWSGRYGVSANSREAIVSPLRWMVAKHGLVRTTLGLTRVADAVGPQLKEYGTILPVSEIDPVVAKKLRMATTPEEVPASRWANSSTASW